MTLKNKALKGIKWTALSSIVIATLQLAQVSILARYLQPSDFGLMAIVSVIIGFSALFMDMGISSAIIHKQDITHKQLSSLYWLNIFAGIILFIVVYFSAAFVAEYYDDLKIVPLVQLLALTFFISAIGNQYRILNQKKLRFNRLAKIEIFSAFASFVVAVFCAIKGFGVYSLVYAALVNVFISNLIFFIQGVREHKPEFTYKHREIKGFINFGMFQMGERSINYFNSQFDVILIGKLLGTEALGVYSVAKTLVMKPALIINPIITKVTFPIMSTIQEDTKRLKDIYLKTINYLCSVNFPIYLLMAILAEPLVLVLFGDKWAQSIPILQILAFYFMLRAIGNPVGALLLAKGRADMGFYWNFGLFLFIPLSVYLGSFKGLTGIAYALLVLQLISIYPAWLLLIKPLCDADFREYFYQIAKPFLACFIAFPLAWCVVNYGLQTIKIAYLDSALLLFFSMIFYVFFTKIFNKIAWSFVLDIGKKVFGLRI